ncbi:MAG: hypothetical protein EOP82_24750 [Variovorax sp.]|nr:MAG: hypothetical protein EOP82_24750 [Variovorax sp.]
MATKAAARDLPSLAGHPALARHIGRSLVADEFDMSFFQEQALDLVEGVNSADLPFNIAISVFKRSCRGIRRGRCGESPRAHTGRLFQPDPPRVNVKW